MLKQNYYCS